MLLFILVEFFIFINPNLIVTGGQLTGTVHATEEDLSQSSQTINLLSQRVGRFVVNGFPTGVEVCNAMYHGGPYPATSNAAHSSVGIDAIKRWLRPVAYQNASQQILPLELRNDNPTGILRNVNGKLTTEKLK